MTNFSLNPQLTGPEKAATLVLTLNEQIASKIFQQMEEWEIIALSQKMANLGSISSETIENLFKEFAQNIHSVSTIVGNIDNTERLLKGAVGREQASRIIEELSGPAGRTMWDKLGNINEELLADYLKNEHPQTVAVVLSKIKTDQSAKILTYLPDDFAVEVVLRLLKIDSVSREVVSDVEYTLRKEFMNNLNRSAKRDTYEILADTLSAMDRSVESKFLNSLQTINPDSAERIKALMFKFEDLTRLDKTGVQTLLRIVSSDSKNLALALKGASNNLKDLFFSNMSERAVKLLRADIVALGSVRLKDVEAAQMVIIGTAKNLIEEGQLKLSDTNAEQEEMIS